MLVCRGNLDTVSLKPDLVMESVPSVSFTYEGIAPNKMKVVNYLKRDSAAESS